MIRRVANCPYCRQFVSIDEEGTLRFTPIRLGRRTCSHMVALNVCLDVWSDRKAATAPRSGRKTKCSVEHVAPTRDWLWVRGLVPLQDCQDNRKYREMLHYVEDLFVGAIAGCNPFPQSLYPQKPYKIVGGTAGQRDEKEAGSGEFELQLGDGPPLQATLDGWALYAPDPERVAAALPELVQRHARSYGRSSIGSVLTSRVSTLRFS